MRRFALYFAIANVIGIFFLWLAARDLPVDTIDAYLATADVGRMLLWSGVFLAIYTVCHAARVVRWFLLVKPLGEGRMGLVNRVCLVGMTAIMLLPLRLGELVRPYLLARRSKVPMSGLLATAVVERVIDGLLMTGLLFVTLGFYDGGRHTEFATSIGLIAAAIFVPALTVCLFALWRREATLRVLRAVGGRIWPSLTDKLLGLLDDFIRGFRGLMHAGAMGRFLLVTAVYWGTNVASMWVLAGYGFGIEIGLAEMATVLPILVIGIMIPAGPAHAGNFEYFLTKALGLFMVVEAGDVGGRVAVFAAALHVLQFVVIVLPGFWVMWVDPETRHLIALSRKAEDAIGE